MAALGTAAELRAQLRRRVGHAQDTALVSDALLDDALADALREVNKFWPYVGTGSFLTVMDQQIYTPLPAGGRRIRRVFWNLAAGCAPLGGIGMPADIWASIDPLFGTDENGIRYTVDPNAILALRRREAYLQRFYGESGGTVRNLVEVYLDPTPSAAGTAVYFTYDANRYASVGAVTDDIGEIATAFLARARWYLHDSLSAGRGALTEVSGPNTTVRTDAGRQHTGRALAALEEFNSCLPPATSGYL